MRRGRVLAPAVVLLSAGLAAQTPQQPPIFRAGVDLLEVDVSVVDDRGHPIADMLGPEFTVTVDGQPRKVASAQFITLRPDPSERRRPSEPVTEPFYSSNTTTSRGRLIVIAVDRESISFGEGRHAMRAASRFLDTLGAADKVAFITVPLYGPAVDFTSNHALIRKELERVAGQAHRPRGQLNLGVQEAFAIDQHINSLAENAALDRFCGMFRPGTAQAEACELEVRAEAAGIVQEVRHQTETSVRSLESVLEALREIEAPKSLVWISEGLTVEGSGVELSGLERLAAAARTTINVLMLDAPLADVVERDLSPTAKEDREMQERGLELLAGYTRGALFRVSANPDYVFQRLEEELSGYYLLGVESVASDADGKRHTIKVSVRRRGAAVRARREFRMPGQAANNDTMEQRLQRLLRSPFAASDMPLRVATYAYRDANSARVRVLVATEIGEAATDPIDVTVAYALVDGDGRMAATGLQHVTIAPTAGGRGPVLQHVGGLIVDPGSYTLKMAAIDGAGRRGSIEHRMQAWQMADVPFAVGDLIVGDVPEASDTLRPSVEARVANGRLAAYLELYGDSAAALDETQVRVEVAVDESGPPLGSGGGVLKRGGDDRSRTVSALVPIAALAPGHYMARAVITRGGKKVGQLARPFEVATPPAGAAAGAATSAAPAAGASISTMMAPPGPFKREDVLRPDVMGFFLDLIDRQRPAAKPFTAQVRKGAFAGAARLAFDAGDQVAATFLRGLELLAANDAGKAAMQFDGALRLAPDLSAAAFYLGACYAAVGRDREAVTTWRRALGGNARTAAQYATLGDALVRLGDTQQAVAALRDAVAAWPDEDQLRRRLGLAYATALQPADALGTIEPYLARHPDDQEALLVALHAIYTAHLEGQPVNAQRDRERMQTYGRAYAAAHGAHAQLVATWVAFVTKP